MEIEILKYYRVRQKLETKRLRSALKLNLPLTYIGFGVKYNPVDIVGLVFKEPYMIGIHGLKRRISIRFIDIVNIAIYYEDDGIEINKEPIVQIAGNNNPQGGIFLDLRDHKIYNLECSPFSIIKTQREVIADSFEELLNNLKLYELSNKDLNYFKEIEIEIPENTYNLKYKWE